MHGPKILVGLLLVLAVPVLAACGEAPQPTTLPIPTSTQDLSPVSSQPTDTPAGESVTWKKFTSEDGGFSALFPGNPTETSSTANTEVGQVAVHTFSYADPGGVGYNVAYSDYPADKVQNDSEQLLNGAVTGIGKTDPLVTQQSTTQQGHPAVNAEFDASGTNHLFYKGVMFRSRLYQIIVVTPTAQEGTYKPDAMKFLDSFEITNP